MTTETLQQATERLCHNCKWWRPPRVVVGISVVGLIHKPEEGHCWGAVDAPVTRTGEDCPYYTKKEEE